MGLVIPQEIFYAISLRLGSCIVYGVPEQKPPGPSSDKKGQLLYENTRKLVFAGWFAEKKLLRYTGIVLSVFLFPFLFSILSIISFFHILSKLFCPFDVKLRGIETKTFCFQ